MENDLISRKGTSPLKRVVALFHRPLKRTPAAEQLLLGPRRRNFASIARDLRETAPSVLINWQAKTAPPFPSAVESISLESWKKPPHPRAPIIDPEIGPSLPYSWIKNSTMNPERRIRRQCLCVRKESTAAVKNRDTSSKSTDPGSVDFVDHLGDVFPN